MSLKPDVRSDKFPSIRRLKQLKPVESHPDLNGGFGGCRAWMVHGKSENGTEDIAVYTFLGFYWDVGRQTPEQKVSRINVAHLMVDAMEEGVPPGWILKSVKLCLKLWQEMGKKGLR